MNSAKLNYSRPAAPPPPDKWAKRSGWVSVLCLLPSAAFVALPIWFHVQVPREHWKYFFICTLVGVLAGMICVDRANGRLASGWIGFVLNGGAVALFILLAIFHV